MKVVIRLDLDEPVLRAIAYRLDMKASKQTKGRRLATREDVHKWCADELNQTETTYKAIESVREYAAQGAPVDESRVLPQ